MSDERFVHAWLLRLDPAWRRLETDDRQIFRGDAPAAQPQAR